MWNFILEQHTRWKKVQASISPSFWKLYEWKLRENREINYAFLSNNLDIPLWFDCLEIFLTWQFHVDVEVSLRNLTIHWQQFYSTCYNWMRREGWSNNAFWWQLRRGCNAKQCKRWKLINCNRSTVNFTTVDPDFSLGACKRLHVPHLHHR